jgi:hypothetical protein
MTAKLTASLRSAPATVPALVALALFVVWATDQGGYPVTHWAPGGLLLLSLLAITAGLVRVKLAEIPRGVRVALGCLAAYTALSYLSILWAGVPGDAWEGANRTLLYLLVFALFASWRQQPLSAAILLGAWTLALAGLALFTILHVDAAGSARLTALLPGGRLVYPSGYANANAAQWLMAFWPAVLLARSPRLPWGLRGLLAGSAVLLAEVALMSQSRGSLYATPVMLLAAFALLPERTRTFAMLVPVGAGIAAAAPAVLHVGDRLRGEQVVAATLHHAVAAALVSAVVVSLIVALAAAVESRRALPEAAAGRLHRATGAGALAALALVLVGGLVAAGNPITRIEHGWNTFKGGYGANSTTGDRLVSGLGSNRYDFFRVALNEFAAHPVAGIGADNFQQQYLVHGRSTETPRYPHSVEFRTISQTGILGSLLAIVGLIAALAVAARAIRGPDLLGRAVSAGALAGFVYWVVHGSFDWFWEFAGLGAPAFALLGMACALAPQRPSGPVSEGAGTQAGEPGSPGEPSERAAARAAWRRPVGLGLAVVLAVACAFSFVGPWLSELEVQRAAKSWRSSPSAAYASLRTASELNPLGDEAYLVAGSIAARIGQLRRARGEFSKALARTPDEAYATLELGVIASFNGERAQALVRLERAVELNPREPLAAEALELVRQGKRLSVLGLNRAILLKGQSF